MFLGRKSSESDYHGEMDAEKFMTWLNVEVFPRMPKPSCLVLDQAPYHMMLTEATKPPSTSLKKSELCEFIRRHGDTSPTETLMLLNKVELLEIAKKLTPPPVRAAVELGEKHGVTVIFLPVAHPELNEIELVGKQHVRRHNTNFKTSSVLKLSREFMATIDGEQWALREAHARK